MEEFIMGSVLKFNQNPKKEIFFYTNQGDILKGHLQRTENDHAVIQVKGKEFIIPNGFYFFGKRALLDHLEQHREFHAELIKKIHVM